MLKAYNTNEQGCLNNYWCARGISGEVRGFLKSTSVRQEIYYTLKDLTNDFEGEIFEKTTQQNVSDLSVNKGEWVKSFIFSNEKIIDFHLLIPLNSIGRWKYDNY